MISTNLTATIKGIRPLLMHNGRLRDPLNPHTRALSSAVKKAKTSKAEADIIEQYHTEFIGALYYDEKLGPYIPADNLQSMLVEGARKRRLGKQVEALVQVLEPDGAAGYKLEYKGKRDPEELFKSDVHRSLKSAKIGQSCVMRCRPRFPDWRVTFNIEVTEGGPTTEQLREALEDAGLLVGLADWTPRYGRFELENLS